MDHRQGRSVAQWEAQRIWGVNDIWWSPTSPDIDSSLIACPGLLLGGPGAGLQFPPYIIPYLIFLYLWEINMA